MSLNTPQYTIRVRDANLVPQGVLAAWTAGDVLLRMNDVGKWAVTVRADDPLRSVFATRGAGVIVTRDRGDGSGAQTIMSGPIWTIDRKGRDNFYTLAGPTDEWWLKARRAMPQGGRPFMEQALLLAPVRYLRLGEASGTTAADSSGNGQSGTINGTVSYGQAGSVSGDPDGAMGFTAANNAYISVPVAGLPSGNGPWTWAVPVKFPSNPASNQTLVCLGTNGTGQWAALDILTGGQVAIDGNAFGTLQSAAALSPNVWHLIIASWDGTTTTLQVDGGTPVTNAPGARSVGTAGCYIGAGVGASGARINQFTGTIDEVMLFNYAMTASQRAALYAAWSATHGQYDTRTGVASTVILGYVNANLIAPVNVDRDMTFMAAAADPSVGTTVSGNARWDELLALLQQLASSGGDIGFKVVQTANGALTFSVYQPSDKSANAKFSQDLQNLFDYSYSLAGPQANSVEVLGAGTGAGRSVLAVRDATSIGNWGLVEGVRDARDTGDTATMQQRGQAEINAQSEQTNLALTPRDTDAVQYGRDYNLGDIVAVTIDGNTITNKIRSVHIQLKTPEQELVTPGIGNPTQGEVARWFDAYAARQQALVRVQSQLNALSAAQ